MQAIRACRAQCTSARTHGHKLRQDSTCAGDARFMGRCGGARQISQPYVPVLRCSMALLPKCRLVPVIHRVAVQTARRIQRTEIGAKAKSCQAHLPRVLAVHSVGFEPWPVIHRGAPPGHAKMRHRCVARVKQLRDQTQREETGGFEGWYLRQALKQVARRPGAEGIVVKPNQASQMTV